MFSVLNVANAPEKRRERISVRIKEMPTKQEKTVKPFLFFPRMCAERE